MLEAFGSFTGDLIPTKILKYSNGCPLTTSAGSLQQLQTQR